MVISQKLKTRGYFGIGIENGKTFSNVGMLYRSAQNMGASFIFIIGGRYSHEKADTCKAWRNIPLYEYTNFRDFSLNKPKDCKLVGVEYPHPKAKSLTGFSHYDRSIYLLGAEDRGLSGEALDTCDQLVYIPTEYCINVAVAGSVVMWDRHLKSGRGS